MKKPLSNDEDYGICCVCGGLFLKSFMKEVTVNHVHYGVESFYDFNLFCKTHTPQYDVKREYFEDNSTSAVTTYYKITKSSERKEECDEKGNKIKNENRL